MLAGHSFDVRGQRWLFDLSGRLVYPPDPAPDEPCWCFSGISFQKCHLTRDQEEPPTTEEYKKDWEQQNDFQICLHHSAPEGCSQSIAKAHTVQRMGGGLASIAQGGKVFGFKPHVMFLQKHGGRLVPELVGIHDASTFRGFCDKHDRELFRPVEVNPFIASPKQLFLLNFRAVARQVHADRVALRHVPFLRKFDRGRTPSEQRQMFMLLEHYRVTSENGLANISAVKAIYDELARTDSCDSTNGFVLYFDRPPELLCAGIVHWDYDFFGRSLDEIQPPAHLCFYNLAVDDGSAAIFSWVGENDAAATLCRSLAAIPDIEKAPATMRFALEYVDNIFVAPVWWESLEPSSRAAIIDRVNIHVQPMYVRPADALAPEAFHFTRANCVGYLAVGEWAQ